MPVGNWQKSSYCGEGESCVHVSGTDTAVSLTESSDPDEAILNTTRRAFAALTHALKTGTPSPHITVSHTPDGLVRIGGVVTTTGPKWETFVRGVQAGEFDHFGRS
ncbi:DUF397 domain-containing protein [Streptomyces sp. NPDC015127]|uniref:DUF397 domain-containing protein n=1 Tax=Streptomyces sp. NPDC015127 TaxID=3364939 RepID=UPI0036F85C61